jgi:RNA polymerase sigma factor (sigma-70 family)
MTPHRLNPVLRHVRSIGGDRTANLPDAVLLARFAASGDEAAFTVLVRRHGPMIFGLCRRLIVDHHAAEDAFQATFLLLAKKARWLRQPDRLGPWLYGVARRVALKVRAKAIRRREVAPVDVPAAAAPEINDLRPVLDAAIARLPSRYRVPVVLCYLQGLTYAEAAERLRCPPGTVATRLSRARDKLRILLVRQGVAPAAGALTAVLTPDATAALVTDELLRTTTRWAAALACGSMASIPSTIVTLTREAGQTMMLDKLKVLAALVVLGVAGTGAGVALSRPVGSEAPAKPDAPPVAQPEVADGSHKKLQSLPMVLLRQKPPDEYRVDAGDVLGLFIEGVLGDANQIPPIINIYQTVGNQPPVIGFPVLVQDDGTISLPLLAAISVRQKSIDDVRGLIVEAYQKGGILKPGARVLASIAKARSYRVTIMREVMGAGGLFETRLTALDLPAYENDVLTALARSGGLPAVSSDTGAVVVVQRGFASAGATAGAVVGGVKHVRIPLHVWPELPLPFKPEDVILKTGDVISFDYDANQGPPHPAKSERDRAVAVTMAVAAPDGRILVQMPAGAWKMFDAAKVTATEIDGKPVTIVADRLKAMTAVLVVADGRPPTEQYLQLAKPGTLVLVVKD